MRLRRAIGIAAAAAAVFTTAAAVRRTGPGDPLPSVPPLTAQALTARYTADARAIGAAANAAGRAGDQDQARALDGMRTGHFLTFDARGQGQAAQVIGNLATARRVAVIVPGSGTSLTTFDSRGTASPGGAAGALAAEAQLLDPGGQLAVIAWLGYVTPDTISPAILTSGDAAQGVAALRSLVYDLSGHGDQVALLCHSYGTVVCGLGSTGGALQDASPLASVPALTPVTWVFQPLAIFFPVGGFAAARSYTGDYRGWLGKRLARLGRPVLVLAAVWVPVAAVLEAAPIPGATVYTLIKLVLSPLWFLCVFAALTALTPAAVPLVRRFGGYAALFPVAVVAGVDAVRFGLGGPAWVGWINVLAGWMVPYLLGIAWARGAFRRRTPPALMLAGGAAATAALVAWAGYPASMVGVNGAAISNLDPPTLAVVTFGIAQAGLALLLREPIARWMRRPMAWAVVATANLSAMTLYLWHQTAFLVVTMAGLGFGRLPGLHTAPSGAIWVAERLGWLPVFGGVLAVLWAMFHWAEQLPPPGPAQALPVITSNNIGSCGSRRGTEPRTTS